MSCLKAWVPLRSPGDLKVFLGNAEDLRDRRFALDDFSRAIVEQGVRSLAHGGLFDRRRVHVLQNKLADVVVLRQELVDPGPAAVAGMAARAAAVRAVQLSHP